MLLFFLSVTTALFGSAPFLWRAYRKGGLKNARSYALIAGALYIACFASYCLRGAPLFNKHLHRQETASTQAPEDTPFTQSQHHIMMGERIMRAANGTISADAMRRFRQALMADPHNGRASYYLAEAAFKKGHSSRAYGILNHLDKQDTKDADWGPEAKRFARQLQTLYGNDIVDTPPISPLDPVKVP